MDYRISDITKWLMLGTALFIDLLELLLTALAVGTVANWATWLASWIIFPVWFIINGAPYTQNKKMAQGAVVGMIVGLIPIVNALPELTTVVFLNIKATREEDTEKQSAQKTNQTLSRVQQERVARKERLINRAA